MAKEQNLESVRGLVPSRPDDAHKGTFGHLFAIEIGRASCRERVCVGV